jgi:hypothetical protein
MTETRGRFVPTYSPELAQYVVVRGDVRVVPTRAHAEDDAHVRATALAVTLNKLYAERAPERMVPGVACPSDGCRYPACGCALANVPAQHWVRDPQSVVERLREADGADFADVQDIGEDT